MTTLTLTCEWNNATNPDTLINMLPMNASPRKLRLFAVACCREIWVVINRETSRKAVDVAELYADGLATDDELDDAWAVVDAAWHTTLVAVRSVARSAVRSVARSAAGNATRSRTWTEDRLRQANLFRAIFGHPFAPVHFDPRWLTSPVLDLGQTIYDERAFNRLPILADALEDAGCHDPRILDHCRGEGPRARGDWVVDLVLGRE